MVVFHCFDTELNTHSFYTSSSQALDAIFHAVFGLESSPMCFKSGGFLKLGVHRPFSFTISPFSVPATCNEQADIDALAEQVILAENPKVFVSKMDEGWFCMRNTAINDYPKSIVGVARSWQEVAVMFFRPPAYVIEPIDMVRLVSGMPHTHAASLPLAAI